MENKSINFAFVFVSIIAFGIICFIGYRVFGAFSNDEPKSKSVSVITKELKKYCEKVNADGKYKSGNNGCYNFICYYNNNDDTYTYDCEDAPKKATKEKKSDLKLKANIAVAAACVSIDQNGNYDDEDNIRCKNFVCTIEYLGKEYSDTCRR